MLLWLSLFARSYALSRLMRNGSCIHRDQRCRNLLDSFMRSLLELTASGDAFLRREAQQAFATIAPLALSDVRRWLQGNSHVISSCVDASVPEMKALENGSKSAA